MMRWLLVVGVVVAALAVATHRRNSAADRRRLDEVVSQLQSTTEPRPDLWAEWRHLHRRHPEWKWK